MSEDRTTDGTGTEGETLTRLVRFLASALDVRYAFVAAHPGRPGGGLTLWLARDYGLRTAFADLAAAPGSLGLEAGRLDLAACLRLAWPHEPELVEASNAPGARVTLVDAAGRALGEMGVLDPDRARRFTNPERLRPLARTATAELLRFWSGAAC
jgi:hypothetical protein